MSKGRTAARHPGNQSIVGNAVGQFALWFGLLGGGVAWLLHLVLAYLIAEFGCLTALRDTRLFGITGVAWLILAVSVATLLVALSAVVVARRSEQRLHAPALADSADQGPKVYLARAGFVSSVLFAFVIAVETVPIFYYLREC